MNTFFNFSVIITSVLFFAAILPLFFAGINIIKKKSSKKIALAVNIVSVCSLCLLIFVMSTANFVSADANGLEPEDKSASASEVESEDGSENVAGLSMGSGLGLLAAALVTGLSCVGGGIAVASSASAAIGAISENPKVFGQALIFVALAEGVALYGLLISMQILARI